MLCFLFFSYMMLFFYNANVTLIDISELGGN